MMHPSSPVREFERQGSVSSLASKFEQLASSDISKSGARSNSSSHSSGIDTPTTPAVLSVASLPPKRPKPAGLRSNPSSSSTASTSTLVGDDEVVGEDKLQQGKATTDIVLNDNPAVTTSWTSPSDNLSPVIQPVSSQHHHLQPEIITRDLSQRLVQPQESQQQEKADYNQGDASSSLKPPPIPHSTRPASTAPTSSVFAPASTPAFAYSISPPVRQLSNSNATNNPTTSATGTRPQEAQGVPPTTKPSTVAQSTFLRSSEGVVPNTAAPASSETQTQTKRSRTPPPIPAARRSRPNTPSASLDAALAPLGTMVSAPASDDAVSPPRVDATSSQLANTSDSPPEHHSLSVASLASKFGLPRSGGSGRSSQSNTRPSSSCSTANGTSPNVSPLNETHTWHKGYDRSASKSASKALQHVTASASSSSLHAGQSGSSSSELHTASEAPHSSNSPRAHPGLQVTNQAKNGQRSRSPPPVPTNRPKSASDVTTSSSNPSVLQDTLDIFQDPPAITKTSPFPPALPARDRSNSVQLPTMANGGPATSRGAQLAPPPPPPRPASSSVDAINRPRSRTGPVGNKERSQGHVNGTGQHRRDTAPAVSGESSGSEGFVPLPPPVRNLQNGETRTASPSSQERSLGVHGHQFASHCADGTLDSSSASDEEDDNSDGKRLLNEMPDASFANRRPPKITPERKVYPKHSVNAFAIHGRYAVAATTHIRIWDTWSGESTGIVSLQGEHKVVAVEFVFSQRDRCSDGSIIWAGTKDGKLYEVDILAQQVVDSKIGAHSHPITGIFRAENNQIVTVCEAGKVQIWSNATYPDAAPSLSSLPRTQRMGEKHTFVQMFGNQLWSSHGPARHSHIPSSANKSPAIRVYDTQSDSIFNATPRALYIPDGLGQVGCIMAGAVIPCQPNIVYLAHESGHISMWERDNPRCVNVIRVSVYAITAIAGVNDLLWTGNREGSIHVYDTTHTPWKVSKAWKASDEPVIGLQVDLATLASLDKLHVASYGRENLIMWDGLMQVDWLEHAMLKREQEFSTYRDIRVFICSWNIDSSKPADLQNDSRSINFLSDALQSSLTVEGEPPEVIVFGLQEVVDLEDKKVTAKSVLLGRKKADALFQDAVSHQYMRWHDRLVQAVRTAMPPSAPYTLLHAENLVGLQSLIFVRTSEKINITDAARVSVKTGMGGRYGNKGAILSRFVIDDSSICFTNCHLAAGQRATRQRNKDLINILENRSAFLQPSGAVPGVYVGGNGQTVFEHEICFLSGDLNYRIDLPRSVVAANIRSHNIKLLLEHDQLIKETKSNQAFRLRSFREADIDFLPTYKFDPGTDDYDSSAKERIPAWCDRILYRVHDPSLRQDHIKSVDYRSWGPTTSDHKPISGLFVVRVKKMDQHARQKVWAQAEAAWAAREKDVLCDAKRFHGLYKDRTDSISS